MKQRLKRWFTLVEMLVVIVIIGILLIIGMGLSRNSLEKLKVKSVSEEFAGVFDTIFLQVNASNYQNQQTYTGIELVLSGWASELTYQYLGESQEIHNQSWVFVWKFIITGLTGDSNALDTAKVVYQPFSPACRINEGNIASLSFSVRTKGRQNACFRLDNTYCRLQSVACE